jgi:transposase
MSDVRKTPYGGWPAVEDLVPPDHLARRVAELVSRVDCGELQHASPPKRRPPYHPHWMLGVWTYASMIGLHHASEVERASKTDAALRWLAGGRPPSSATLKRFRANHGELFAAANEQVLKLAAKAGLLDHSELAVDSLRLRADASTKAVRTVTRSTARIEELSKVDVEALSVDDRAKHAAKVEKHRAALEACEASGRSNVVLTAPSAGLLKFPNGASAPGHRITATAAGRSSRFILHVFVDAANVDYGHLEAAVVGARDVLDRIGARPDVVKVSADPGYHSEPDLTFAAENRAWADILIRERAAASDTTEPTRYFDRSAFDFRPDDTVICPAGRQMIGPGVRKGGEWWWRGDGCSTCELRPKCTGGRGNRVVTARPAFEKARAAMRERMSRPDAAKQYGGRMAIIEPVFSNLVDAMRFARASSRKPTTVTAEVLLKVLAHNLWRISCAQPMRAVWIVVDVAEETGDYRSTL